MSSHGIGASTPRRDVPPRKLPESQQEAHLQRNLVETPMSLKTSGTRHSQMGVRDTNGNSASDFKEKERERESEGWGTAAARQRRAAAAVTSPPRCSAPAAQEGRNIWRLVWPLEITFAVCVRCFGRHTQVSALGQRAGMNGEGRDSF